MTGRAVRGGELAAVHDIWADRRGDLAALPTGGPDRGGEPFAVLELRAGRGGEPVALPTDGADRGEFVAVLDGWADRGVALVAVLEGGAA